ncbi:MAG TPA: hypothetical protein VHB51_01530 [Candidatus Saccharimonadales bacterium]|nr:hypothetical protein [Candidatus Saccharimonadales bacterium]
MKLKKLFQLGAATLLSTSSLMILTIVPARAATALYWCNTSGGNFNTAANWNTASDCSSGTQQVPTGGEDLIFDVTGLTADETVNNDISSLAVNSISFTGSNATFKDYTLSGNGITLNGDISDSTALGRINLDLTLGANITVTQTGSNSFSTIFGDPNSPSTITTQGNSITFTDASGGGENGVIVNDALVGNGDLIINKTNAGVAINGHSPSYSGAVTVTNGILGVNTTDGLGSTSGVTVSGTGTLGLGAGSGNTFNFPLSLSGPGVSGGSTVTTASTITWGVGGAGSVPAITFAGPVTLASDVTFSGGGDLNITGTFTSNGHSFTTLSGSTGKLTIGAPKAAPKSPDTGFAPVVAHVIPVLVVTVLSAGSLLFISRRIKPTSK